MARPPPLPGCEEVTDPANGRLREGRSPGGDAEPAPYNDDEKNVGPRVAGTWMATARLKCIRAYAIALTSQVTVCGKAITMTSARPCRAMNGRAPLWMSMTFTSLGATVWR